MNLKCWIGLHEWSGCKCGKCDKIRDEEHDTITDCEICVRCRKSLSRSHRWDGCKCSVCGATRDVQHEWSSDCEMCNRCGKTREGAHDWSQDCERCAKCDKTREGAHDWSQDCERCARCSKTRSGAHNWIDCQCSRCGIHKWNEFSCEKCGQLNYIKIINQLYGIGKKLDIVGFGDRTRTALQYMREFMACETEADKRRFIIGTHNYLTGVIQQMFNPEIYPWDVRALNDIAVAVNKTSDSDGWYNRIRGLKVR